MKLVCTPAVASYIRMRFPVTADLVARMGGKHKHSVYRLLSGDTGTLGDEATAALAAGLGITETALLQVAVGAGDGGHVPDLLVELCRSWDNVDETAKKMILAVVAAALPHALRGAS